MPIDRVLNPPSAVKLTVLPDVACPYLPGRVETLRAVMASRIDGATYQAFMDAGFRRSGRMIYQPVCRDCRECRQLRVPTATFRPTTSQRRCVRKNADLRVEVGPPELTDEKAALYARYVQNWHGRPDEGDPDRLREFLYDSPTDSLEFAYRDPAGRLLAVGLCDLGPASLSSVYFYFDPADAGRSLGTFGALHEINWAAGQGIGYYYLGYWIRDCSAMTYKANFRPAEVLGTDGAWHVLTVQ
ncbi:MAG TPA: arginyltransferase [Tepidisphaeraceae bacterium]